MTQFHQEEQKRFEANMLDGDTIDDCGSAILDARECLEYVLASNSRAMKHILEELLAEIPEDEFITEDTREYGTIKVTWGNEFVNQERSRQRASITKKLSDIALEE